MENSEKDPREAIIEFIGTVEPNQANMLAPMVRNLPVDVAAKILERGKGYVAKIEAGDIDGGLNDIVTDYPMVAPFLAIYNVRSRLTQAFNSRKG